MAVALWLSLGLEWVAAVVFGALAAVLLLRPTRDDAMRLATLLFALWWLGLAATSFLSGLRILLVAFDMPLTVIVGLTFVSTSAFAIGLTGLLYYLVFLFTGRAFLLWPVLSFYAILSGWLISTYATLQPVGVVVEAWGTSLAYAQPFSDTHRLLVALAFFTPQIVAVAALLVLARHVPPSGARVRMIVVAWGLLAYFLNVLVAPAYGGASGRVVAELVPIVVGLAVLIVHRPPRWLSPRVSRTAPASQHREASEP